jgi:hypothetical protein
MKKNESNRKIFLSRNIKNFVKHNSDDSASDYEMINIFSFLKNKKIQKKAQMKIICLNILI